MYHGGKNRLAPKIAPYIIEAGADCTHYLEPFIGGAAVFAEVAWAFATATGGDAMPDISALWEAVVHDGWEPPTTLTREEYAALRHAAPSPLRAFAGFGCSFGGMFFAGYAANRRGDDFVGAAHRGIVKKARKMERCASVRFECADYRSWHPGEGTLVYCDPPYVGTAGYDWAGAFDPDEFRQVVEEWAAAGAIVLVSEQTAPAHWDVIYAAEQRSTLSADDNRGRRTEVLYRVVPS